MPLFSLSQKVNCRQERKKRNYRLLHSFQQKTAAKIRFSISVCGSVFVRTCVAVWFGGWRDGSWCGAFWARLTLHPLLVGVKKEQTFPVHSQKLWYKVVKICHAQLASFPRGSDLSEKLTSTYF